MHLDSDATIDPAMPMETISYSMDSFHTTSASTPTIYVPIVSPPTPAQSPRPQSHIPLTTTLPFASSAEFGSLSPASRLTFLSQLLGQCNSEELLFVSTTIAPWMKRDFLKELPVELAINILQFVNNVGDLVRNVGGVSKYWRQLSRDECIWRQMCFKSGFMSLEHLAFSEERVSFMQHFKTSFVTSTCH